LIAASLTFLTPGGALLALTAAAPLAALALAAWRERRARAVLGLAPPTGARRWRRPAAVLAIAALLGLAASQPALRSSTAVRVRTDAQAFYVIDVSRSMLASRAPRAAARISRARNAAIRLRQELLDVPSGVATLTDRVLPDLLPVADRDSFEQTVRHAARIDNPPPESDAVTATALDALGALGTQSFFAPQARHRIAIVLTDGESRPFDARRTARALHGVTPVFVRVGSTSENVYDPDGRPEPAYHPDASSGAPLGALADATRTHVFSEGELGAVVRAVRSSLGRGPTRAEGSTFSTHTLAPYAALAALAPLLALLAEGRRLPVAALRAKLRAA
jgi:hypothetical protein